MVVHLLLWMVQLSRIHNAPLDASVLQRVHAAFDFISTWIDPVAGHAPNYGANDGSLIFPLSLSDYGDYRPLLQLGASVLERRASEAGALG